MVQSREEADEDQEQEKRRETAWERSGTPERVRDVVPGYVVGGTPPPTTITRTPN